MGNDPDDWKPIKTVGTDVREIGVREASGAYGVIILTTFPTVYWYEKDPADGAERH